MAAGSSVLKNATRAATDAVESALIQAALDDARGSQRGAARLLGISHETIRYKIARLGLAPTATTADPTP